MRLSRKPINEAHQGGFLYDEEDESGPITQQDFNNDAAFN